MKNNNEIAIIGMSCIFPQSRNLDEYWNVIINEIDTIVDIPIDRWNIDDYYNADRKAIDKIYTKRGGFIPDIDFDPIEFGLPPNILEITDVSQLLSLVVAKNLFKDANYSDAPANLLERTSIILGVGGGQKLITPLTSRLQYPVWDKVLKSYNILESDRNKIIEKFKKAYVKWEEGSFPGLLGNVISGRIANKFNLGGTNCVVDAACASSLAAIKMAISDLLEYRSDMAITGGVDTDNSPFMYMCFSKTPAFTTDSKCKPFDDNSNGMLIGEGVGMVMLKRLEDAIEAGDKIYSIIKGIGTSSDGKSKSIYAPDPKGQLKALQRAYSEAKINPSSVGIIEAHGTGTAAGDPIEFEALNSLFSENNEQKNYIALGSVKSQIGHTKAAAGIAGLIKASLSIYNKTLPPTINVEKPNSVFKIENSPFYLNTKNRPWFLNLDNPLRIAGVSAFGFGGTNFHVVLEEYKNQKHFDKSFHHFSIIVSEKDVNSLIVKCKQISNQINSGEYSEFITLYENSLFTAIPDDNPRIGISFNTINTFVSKLEKSISLLEEKKHLKYWDTPDGIFFKKEGLPIGKKIVALFSGQGSQYIDMAKDIIINHHEFYEIYEKADKLFCNSNQIPISKIVYPIPVFRLEERDKQIETLRNTKYAQPAIGLTSIGLLNILRNVGFSPDIVSGHSFGELTALYAAGIFSEEDYIYLAKNRGEFMANMNDNDTDSGSMLAIIFDLETVKRKISEEEDIYVANINSPQQIVVGGGSQAIDRLYVKLTDSSIKVIKLPVSGAFHTKYVEHAVERFCQVIDEVKFSKPQSIIYSNTTGKIYSDKVTDIKNILKGNLLNRVDFQKQIENIYDDGGYIFIEIGPKNILTSLVDSILGDKEHFSIAINRSENVNSEILLREAILKMKVLGIKINGFKIEGFFNFIVEDRKKSPACIKINGANYTNPKTKQDFETSLTDDFFFETNKIKQNVENKTIASNLEMQNTDIFLHY